MKESLSVAAASSSSSSVENALRIKEWEVDMYQNEIAISQGVRIRRKPPSKAPLGYSGPFELRLHHDGQAADSPRNILEEITWYKDDEVSRVRQYKKGFFFLFQKFPLGLSSHGELSLCR